MTRAFIFFLLKCNHSDSRDLIPDDGSYQRFSNTYIQILEILLFQLSNAGINYSKFKLMCGPLRGCETKHLLHKLG